MTRTQWLLFGYMTKQAIGDGVDMSPEAVSARIKSSDVNKYMGVDAIPDYAAFAHEKEQLKNLIAARHMSLNGASVAAASQLADQEIKPLNTWEDVKKAKEATDAAIKSKSSKAAVLTEQLAHKGELQASKLPEWLFKLRKAGKAFMSKHPKSMAGAAGAAVMAGGYGAYRGGKKIEQKLEKKKEITPETLKEKLQAFFRKDLQKQAGIEGAISALTEPVAETATWATKKGIALTLLAPLLFGASIGVLQSKMTSPSTKFRTAQKGLVASELEQSLAEMERRRQAALLKERLSNAGTTERTAHI